jgi:hypothetical protein
MNEKTYLKKVLIFIILFSISFIPSTTIITEDGSFTTGAEVWQYNINESNKTIIYEEKKIQKDYLLLDNFRINNIFNYNYLNNFHNT